MSRSSWRAWSHQWGGDHGIYGTATDYMKIRWNALAHPGNRPDIRLSNMALYLVTPAVEMSLELYISQQLEEAITIQYERIRDARVRYTCVKRLETRLEPLPAEDLHWDTKEPTKPPLT